MSTRMNEREEYSNGVSQLARTASRAASMIDDRVHRGADAVSNMAHQAADQVGHASDYVWSKSEKLREKAAGAADVANQHPVYTLLTVAALGMGLGFMLRGARTRT
jgi:hypothetical protein